MKTKSLLLSAAFAAFAFTASGRADTPIDEARAALTANNLPKAESLLVPLTGADATDAASFHALGQLREKQRRLKEAVAAYEQATKLDATKPEYFSDLGVALSQRMGELSFMQQAMTAGKMKKAFEKSVELDARHVAGLIGLARYYINAPAIAGGSMEKAMEFAGRVRALDPFLGEVEQGNVARADEKYADALAHYAAAAQLNPHHGHVEYLCGTMLEKLERKDEARTHYTAALKLDPNLESAKEALAALDAPAS